MKTKFNLLLAAMLFMNWLNVNAQGSSFKIGGNINADYVRDHGEKISYPSWEVSFEKPVAKKWSFSLGFNYAVRKYPVQDNGYRFTNYDKAFLLEGRYYFSSNSIGPFVQFGVPIIFTDQKVYWTDGASSFEGKYQTKLAMNAFAGLGIKYPLTPKWGIEVSINASAPFDFFDVNYGTGGFIKSGFKLTYNLKKGREK